MKSHGDISGNIYKSNNYGYFKVIRMIEYSKNPEYEIEFIDEYFGVKFRRYATRRLIYSGDIQNKYFPSILNVACLGNRKANDDRRLYDRWHSMIRRCYDKNRKDYKWYGAKGITVCNRWLCFEYFCEDFVKLDGYEVDKDLVMDKDLKLGKEYSPDTVILISNKDNVMEKINRLNTTVYIAENMENSTKIEFLNISKFARDNLMSQSAISDCLNNKRNHHKNFKFYIKN